MYLQCRFRVLVGLLVLVSGCINDEVAYGTTQDVATEGPIDGTDGGTDGETTQGTDDGAELDWEWVPVVVDEFIVDQAPMPRPTPGRWPVAAFDGNQYLVVWEDHRARRPILYGGRITADGTALDPLGFPILDVRGAGAYRLSVAFDGSNFLIVTALDEQILGVRVSPAGKVLDPGGIVIADEVGWSAWPSLAFDGEQYLVAWADLGIYRARVKPDGTVLDPDGVLTYPLSHEWTRMGVSFDGANHLLSWVGYDFPSQTSVLNAGRIAPDGTLLDETPILSQIISYENSYFSPVAGFDGTNHVIAWAGCQDQDEDEDPQYEVAAVRVTPDGVSLDPEGIPLITDPAGEKYVNRLAIATAVGSSDVVWTLDHWSKGGPSADRIRGARIATDGTTSLHPQETFPFGLEPTPVVGPNGGLLLWRDGEDPGADYPAITGMRRDGAGLPVDGSVFAPAAPASRQDVKAVASDGHNFFVLWTDTRDPTGEGKALYGTRVAADSTPLDPEPIQFDIYGADLADVVFDGANFVITWVRFTGGEGDDGPFNTVRVSTAGELLDIMPLPVPLSSSTHTLAGASDGTHTLLVGRGDWWQNELSTMLLDQQGGVTSAVPILDVGQSSRPPAVSFGGLEYLVVWIDVYGEAFGQRINQAGALEGSPFSIVALEHPHVLSVATAGGGGNHLVVWEDESGVWATQVGPGGQVLDPDGVLLAVPALGGDGCWNPDLFVGSCASVVFDGENFIVAWRAPSIPGDASSLDLYAAKLSPEGEVSSQVAISQGPEREGRPFLAVGDEGVLAAYNDFVPGPPYDTRRAVARLIVP